MNPKIQKLLCDLAQHAGTELIFADGLPTRFYGCQHTEAPIAVINSDLPQCEQIFTILHEIGHFVLHHKKPHSLPIPALINRPYENKHLAEATYKIKRALRVSFGQEWQADLWATCAFFEIGCPDDFHEFFKRHPRKMKLFPIIIPIILKCRLQRWIQKKLRVVVSNAKTS